jgi:hypothetical protein
MTGSDTILYDLFGQKWPCHYELIDISSGLQHPDMTRRDLTPEDRERAIFALADRLDPSLLVSRAATPWVGPPVLGPDGLVEAGNKRFEALRILRDQRRYDVYSRYLSEKVAEYGMPRWALESRQAPVLVRVRDGRCETWKDRVLFSRLSNYTPEDVNRILGQAESDGAACADLLDRVRCAPTEDAAEGLDRPENSSLLTQILETLPPESISDLAVPTDTRFRLTTTGQERLRLAQISGLISDRELLFRLSEDL